MKPTQGLGLSTAFACLWAVLNKVRESIRKGMPRDTAPETTVSPDCIKGQGNSPTKQKNLKSFERELGWLPTKHTSEKDMSLQQKPQCPANIPQSLPLSYKHALLPAATGYIPLPGGPSGGRSLACVAGQRCCRRKECWCPPQHPCPSDRMTLRPGTF